MSRVILKQNLTSSSSSYEEKAWTEPAINFRTGMFRPILEEANNLNCKIIQGSIPEDMPSGTYYRNGPNPMFPPKENDPYHYFDGDGMIASFTISTAMENNITFSHKWVNTERLQTDTKKNFSVYEFGGMATGNFLFEDTINEQGIRMGKANTSLVFHNNKLLALEEADLPYIINPKSLSTIGLTYKFENNNNNNNNNLFKQKENRHNIFTAHPKMDNDTQELIGYGCGYDPTKSIFDYYVIGPNGKITTSFPIHMSRTAYTHDFAITKNYSLCFDSNLFLNWKNLFDNSSGGGDGMWQFDDSTKGRIGIFPRHATSEDEVIWFEVEPFCVSHTVNAYEDNDTIVLICNNIGYEGFQPTFPLETPRDPLANLHQWRFNMKTKQVHEQTLRGNVRSDFPVINLQYTGKKNRYLYSQLVNYEEPNHAPFLFGAYKYDLQTNTYKEEIWKGSDDSNDDDGKFYGSEGIFVPRRNHQEEDDGYMLVLVNNVNKRRTELRIYDCKSFGEKKSLKCTIASPRRLIPLGTHGIWLNEYDVMMEPSDEKL